MQKLIFILSIIVLCCACTPAADTVYDIAIHNVNLIDIKTGNITNNHIYISDQKISKIVTTESPIDVKALQRIDGTGKYVLPGFWDNHIHLRGGDQLIAENKKLLPIFIANGITTVRDAGGNLTTSILKWRKEIQNHNLIGPTIYTSGPKLDGANPRWSGSLVVENKNDVIKALDSLQKIPSDFVKIYDSKISAENYINILNEAKKRKIISSGHMPFTLELHQAIDAGIGAIEHLYYVLKGCSSKESQITKAIINKELGFWNSMNQLRSTYQDSTAQKTFELLKKNNTYVVPTLHIGNTLSYLDETDHTKDPYLKLMGPGIITSYEGRIQRARNATDEAVRSRKELNTFFKKLTKSLQKAEVKLLAGSDCGAYNSYTYPGISLHKELQALVEAGLSPLEALQSSSYNGAKFLKKESISGTVEIGKQADLVVLYKNPLENIRHTQNIYKVIQGNKIHDPNEIAKQYNCSDCIIAKK